MALMLNKHFQIMKKFHCISIERQNRSYHKEFFLINKRAGNQSVNLFFEL